MRVYLGSDHAGYELKAHLAEALTGLGHEVVDIGPKSYDPDDDYPAYCLVTAARVVGDAGSLGIVIGGSGNGEQIAANKVPGARVALAWSEQTARLAREHSDDEALAIVKAFLDTPCSDGGRHRRRIGQIAEYERSRQLPSLH